MRNLFLSYSVDDDSALIVHYELIGNLFDGVHYLAALAARVGDQEEMRDFFHYSSVDLLDTRFAVDNYVVKVVSQQADDLLEVCVHLAVAAGSLRSSDSEEAELLLLEHGVEDSEPCLVEHLDCFLRAAFLNASDDLFTDSVERVSRLYAERCSKSDGRVSIDRKDPRIRVLLSEDPDHRRADRSFSDAAFTGYC